MGRTTENKQELSKTSIYCRHEVPEAAAAAVVCPSAPGTEATAGGAFFFVLNVSKSSSRVIGINRFLSSSTSPITIQKEIESITGRYDSSRVTASPSYQLLLLDDSLHNTAHWNLRNSSASA